MSLLPRPIKFKKGDVHSSEYFKRNVSTDTLFIWKGFMGSFISILPNGIHGRNTLVLSYLFLFEVFSAD